MPNNGTKQKAEMTVEEFASKYDQIIDHAGDPVHDEEIHDECLSDLRSVIRGELKGLQKYDAIDAELQRAKEIHPVWPDSIFQQLAIMQEEAGEVTKAILDFSFHKGPVEDIKKELIQTAAMCMRMLERFGVEY